MSNVRRPTLGVTGDQLDLLMAGLTEDSSLLAQLAAETRIKIMQIYMSLATDSSRSEESRTGTSETADSSFTIHCREGVGTRIANHINNLQLSDFTPSAVRATTPVYIYELLF